MKRSQLWPRLPGPLILASSSPRRRELLAAQGVRFAVVSPEVDETPGDEHPRALARRLALAKAEAVRRARRRAWSLGADTIVSLGRTVLGKPVDAADARRMLRLLSGRRHLVHTGVALVGPGFRRARVVATRVRFRALPESEVRAYVETGEPFDKAGGYAAQGRGAVLLAGLEGDWTNVVGLPLAAVRELFLEARRAVGGPRRRS